MLPDRSSTPSGSIKLLFLALAVLVVLAQTSPDGWLKKCYYGLGRCRKSCKEEEKKREKCGKTLTCCLLSKNAKLSHFSPRPVTEEREREIVKIQKDDGVCEPRRGAWEETNTTDILISDCETPEL
uniref:beta-defensin 115 n=1 Tax=Urocitellus parryii TaxID=9999 RepID=UPI000E55DA36|nr:beta-defensin 115 [Urocitellus parryii]